MKQISIKELKALLGCEDYTNNEFANKILCWLCDVIENSNRIASECETENKKKIYTNYAEYIEEVSHRVHDKLDSYGMYDKYK